MPAGRTSFFVSESATLTRSMPGGWEGRMTPVLAEPETPSIANPHGFEAAPVPTVARLLTAIAAPGRRLYDRWRGGDVMGIATVKQLLAGLGAGIEATPGVCGGDPRIAGTRVAVRTLEQYRRTGMPEAEILANFPTLRAADLVNAWAYVDANPEQIERQIVEDERA